MPYTTDPFTHSRKAVEIYRAGQTVERKANFWFHLHEVEGFAKGMIVGQPDEESSPGPFMDGRPLMVPRDVPNEIKTEEDCMTFLEAVADADQTVSGASGDEAVGVDPTQWISLVMFLIEFFKKRKK